MIESLKGINTITTRDGFKDLWEGMKSPIKDTRMEEVEKKIKTKRTKAENNLILHKAKCMGLDVSEEEIDTYLEHEEKMTEFHDKIITRKGGN